MEAQNMKPRFSKKQIEDATFVGSVVFNPDLNIFEKGLSNLENAMLIDKSKLGL